MHDITTYSVMSSTASRIADVESGFARSWCERGLYAEARSGRCGDPLPWYLDRLLGLAAVKHLFTLGLPTAMAIAAINRTSVLAAIREGETALVLSRATPDSALGRVPAHAAAAIDCVSIDLAGLAGPVIGRWAAHLEGLGEAPYTIDRWLRRLADDNPAVAQAAQQAWAGMAPEAA